MDMDTDIIMDIMGITVMAMDTVMGVGEVTRGIIMAIATETATIMKVKIMKEVGAAMVDTTMEVEVITTEVITITEVNMVVITITEVTEVITTEEIIVVEMAKTATKVVAAGILQMEMAGTTIIIMEMEEMGIIIIMEMEEIIIIIMEMGMAEAIIIIIMEMAGDTTIITVVEVEMIVSMRETVIINREDILLALLTWVGTVCRVPLEEAWKKIVKKWETVMKANQKEATMAIMATMVLVDIKVQVNRK